MTTDTKCMQLLMESYAMLARVDGHAPPTDVELLELMTRINQLRKSHEG